jgi:hypothetical protein
MTTSRAELDALLDDLQDALPKMIAENPDDGDFWSEFAGQAEVIEDRASAADCDHVGGRINAMLAKHGLPQREPS